MKIDILTLFPDMFTGPFDESIVHRAKTKGLAEINIHHIRKWSTNKHNTVDDRPYGGGAGMVLQVDVIDNAISDFKSTSKGKVNSKQPHVILLSPQGKRYDQQDAVRLSKLDHIILIAGHYEGYDQRIVDHLIDEEISIGDYVLTGGELPAMVIVDSLVRLIPGVLGDEGSLVGETHSEKGFIKHPVYTRPEVYNGWKVPEVLLTGNHKEIDKWKNSKVKRTTSE